MEEGINLELDITQLHIGQLIQVKETKEIVKITAIDSIVNTILTNPNTPYINLKDFQEIPKPKNAFWLVERYNNGETKECGFYAQEKEKNDIAILEARDFALKKMKDNEDICKIDIINNFKDINYIQRAK